MRQSEFYKGKEGLDDMVVADRLEEYGPNFIKISVPPILYLLFHEVKLIRHIIIEEYLPLYLIHLTLPIYTINIGCTIQ